MIKPLMTAVFGSRFDRERKRIQPIVDQIHAHEERLKDLNEAELKAQTARSASGWRTTGALKAELDEVREAKHGCADPVERDRLEGRFHELERRVQEGTRGRRWTSSAEAFATVREACRRLVGTTSRSPVTSWPGTWCRTTCSSSAASCCTWGKIAEMATGEGKTLVATLPLYLNALAGRGAHLVTVNNYLARRDSQWMGHVYTYLGLTVGCLDDTEPSTPERRAAYLADITYGTNNEFGFDYLRDNMVFSLEQRVQRSTRTPSSTRWTRSSSTRRGRRSSSAGPVGNETDEKYPSSSRRWPSWCGSRPEW